MSFSSAPGAWSRSLDKMLEEICGHRRSKSAPPSYYTRNQGPSPPSSPTLTSRTSCDSTFTINDISKSGATSTAASATAAATVTATSTRLDGLTLSQKFSWADEMEGEERVERVDPGWIVLAELCGWNRPSKRGQTIPLNLPALADVPAEPAEPTEVFAEPAEPAEPAELQRTPLRLTPKAREFQVQTWRTREATGETDIVRALKDRIPRNELDELSSIGSIAHDTGRCQPCLFWFQLTCPKGVNCTYCHLWHRGQKTKRIRMSKKVRENHAVGIADSQGRCGSYEGYWAANGPVALQPCDTNFAYCHEAGGVTYYYQ